MQNYTKYSSPISMSGKLAWNSLTWATYINFQVRAELAWVKGPESSSKSALGLLANSMNIDIQK